MTLSIKNLNLKIFQLGCCCICVLLVLTSFLREEPLNPDALLYLQTAQVYSSFGLKASLAVFSWPFLSITIAFTHKLTSLSLEQCAYLLNLIFVSLFVYAFINFTKILSSNNFFIFSAGILITIYPTLIHAANLITRDLGYWTFSLLALNQILRFSEKYSLRSALLFSAFQLLASLYRYEGILLLLGMPFAFLFFIPRPTRLKNRFLNFIQFFILPLVLIIFISIFSFRILSETYLNHPLPNTGDLLFHTLDAWQNNWVRKINALKIGVLEPSAKDSGFLVLLGGSVFVFLFVLAKAINGFYFLLSLHGFYLIKNKKSWAFLNPLKPQDFVLFLFFLLNFFILFVFTLQHQFLAPRYALLFCLLFLILAAKSLEHILFFQRKKWLKVAASTGLTFLLLSSLIHTGPSKHDIIQAGQWLRQLPPSKTIYSNNAQIMYYAGRQFTYTDDTYNNENLSTLIKQKKLHHYDYIVVHLSRHTPLPPPLKTMTPITYFSSPRGGATWVFSPNPDL